jgi:Flp pilus assembly protein TadD
MVRPFALVLYAIGSLAGCASSAPLPPKAVELNQTGAAALEAGDLATAEARIALAIEYNPRFVEAWVNLGLIELRRGNFKEAYKHLRRARDINPDLPAPHHAIGLLFDQRDMGKEAEANYRAALKVDPGFAPARINLGRRLFARGAFEEAEEQFLRLTQVSPTTLDGWLGLAESLWQLGRDDEADEVIAKTRQRFGDGPEVSLLVARQLLKANQYPEAERTLATLTEHPDASRRAYAWAWLAIARLGNNNFDGAIEAAEEALKIDRDQAVATHAMGAALEQRRDPRAAAWVARSRALSPRAAAVAPKGVSQ